jgi:hypothetical protein
MMVSMGLCSVMVPVGVGVRFILVLA